MSEYLNSVQFSWYRFVLYPAGSTKSHCCISSFAFSFKTKQNRKCASLGKKLFWGIITANLISGWAFWPESSWWQMSKNFVQFLTDYCWCGGPTNNRLIQRNSFLDLVLRVRCYFNCHQYLIPIQPTILRSIFCYIECRHTRTFMVSASGPMLPGLNESNCGTCMYSLQMHQIFRFHWIEISTSNWIGKKRFRLRNFTPSFHTEYLKGIPVY